MFYMKLCYALLLVPTHAYVNMEGNRLKHRGLFEIMFRWIMTEPFVYFDIYVKKGYFDNRKFININNNKSFRDRRCVWLTLSSKVNYFVLSFWKEIFHGRLAVFNFFRYWNDITPYGGTRKTNQMVTKWDPVSRMKTKILLENAKLKAMYTV